MNSALPANPSHGIGVDQLQERLAEVFQFGPANSGHPRKLWQAFEGPCAPWSLESAVAEDYIRRNPAIFGNLSSQGRKFVVEPLVIVSIDGLAPPASGSSVVLTSTGLDSNSLSRFLRNSRPDPAPATSEIRPPRTVSSPSRFRSSTKSRNSSLDLSAAMPYTDNWSCPCASTPFALAPAQHGNNVRGSESLTGTNDCGKRLLRNLCRVVLFPRPCAVVAPAAPVLSPLFAEVLQHVPAAAGAEGAEGDDPIQPLSCPLSFLIVLYLIYEEFLP